MAQFFVTIDLHGPTTSTRLIRLLSFFTIQSNVLVCVTSWGLVLRPTAGRAAVAGAPDRRDRRHLGHRPRLQIALSGLQHLHGWARLCDNVFHYVVPIATFVGWLLVGPRGRVDRATVLWGLVWPLLWFAYTLVHGAKSGWYPYHFIDVKRLGYGRRCSTRCSSPSCSARRAGRHLAGGPAGQLTHRARRTATSHRPAPRRRVSG